MSPKFTTALSKPFTSFFPNNAILIRGKALDDRGLWANGSSMRLVDVTETGKNAFNWESGSDKGCVRIRSPKNLEKFLDWAIGGAQPLFIDITTLPNHIWAPILRRSLERDIEVSVTYAEPDKYKRKPEPDDGFDLSERIQRLGGITGFGSFEDEFERDYILVALLGFEGSRFEYVVSKLEPESWQVVPLIGVPGFQPEFPSYVYFENFVTLDATKSTNNVRFSPANCPFMTVSSLEKIANDNSCPLIKIAPIGTKPHALGALLFSILSTKRVSFIYDNPIKKSKRTSGLGLVHVYDVSKFCNENEMLS